MSGFAGWPSTPAWLREVRRTVRRHRRLLAAALAASSVALLVTALSPAPPETVAVLTAARDLPGGEALSPRDLTSVALAPETVPAGALRPGRDDPSGRILAGPARSGEPLTDTRLVGPSLLRGYGDGLVAAPVRIADAGSVQMLSVGDVVDVLAAETDLAGAAAAGGTRIAGESSARAVAAGVRVIAVPTRAHAGAADEGALGAGALIVLAVNERVAADLARAAVTARLSITLRGPRA